VRGLEVVAGVIAAFFAIGIGIGVLLVAVMPVLRRRRGTRAAGRENDDRQRYGLPPGYGDDDDDGPGWQEPPGPDAPDAPDAGQRPPPWPGRRG
jgi:hypothetical protein